MENNFDVNHSVSYVDLLNFLNQRFIEVDNYTSEDIAEILKMVRELAKIVKNPEITKEMKRIEIEKIFVKLDAYRPRIDLVSRSAIRATFKNLIAK